MSSTIRPMLNVLAMALALSGASVPVSAQADVAATADVSDAANWRRVAPENVFIFDTTRGRIVIEAFPWAAPAHVEQFRRIIRSGDFDGTAFHRVIDDFMAQGGDIYALKGRESGEPDLRGEFTFQRDPYTMVAQMIGEPDSSRNGWYEGAPLATQSAFVAEMNDTGTVESWIPHCPGVVSTARTDDPDSANSQFFLMRQTSHHLDRSYTAWGRVVSGLDVVRAIKAGPESRNGAVDAPDILTRARVAADLPEGQGVSVYVQRTDGPDFAATLPGIAARTDVCDLDAVAAVIVDAGG